MGDREIVSFFCELVNKKNLIIDPSMDVVKPDDAHTLDFTWDDTTVFAGQAKMRLNFLVKFLTPDTLNEILPYMEHKGPVSLRILEWYCTNYSKQFDPELHYQYLTFRNNWKRHLFDCFARQQAKSPIIYLWYQKRPYRTTVAQIQFLLWARQYKVLQKCIEHEDAIEAHMGEILAKNYEAKQKAKENGQVRKRSTLTQVDIHQGCVITIATTIHLSHNRDSHSATATTANK